MNRPEEAERQAQQRASREQGVRPKNKLDWLFSRPDIPKSLKDRFWTYSDVRDLRLGHVENYENLKKLVACLEQDILLYIQERGDDITSKQMSWLNQLYFHFMINLTGSLGKEDRDMSLVTEERGRWKSEYEAPNGMEE